MKNFVVSTNKPYDVLIGHDILKHVGQYISERIAPCRACVITDTTVNNIYAQVVITSLMEFGFQTSKVAFPSGEHSKTLSTYTNIMEALAEEGITRSDILIALGGGVVGDMTGFVASTYMRGITYIQIPTTYLAAVDSSVGGKTGINLRSGKNLAGSFLQPDLVITDYKTFDSLPHEKLKDGIAEAIKNAVVSEGSLIEQIEANNYEYVIERCVSIKKSVVEVDEYDKGLRQLLNLGHTIGHGIEKLSRYNVSHGEAVAQGMIVESRAAYKMGLTETDITGRLIELFEKSGFNLTVPYSPSDLYHYALMDKKINGEHITIIVPETLGKCKLHKLPMTDLNRFIELGLEND